MLLICVNKILMLKKKLISPDLIIPYVRLRAML